MDLNLSKMVFTCDVSLGEATDRILAGARKVGFCVDESGKLCGILTEGDVLRAFRAGASPGDLVRNHLNTSPVTAADSLSVSEVKKLISRRIQLIPQVDARGRLVGVVDLSTAELGFVNIKNRNVLVLGLGYVGLTLALTLADAGFSINGLDINPELMGKLRRKEPPFFENGLDELLDRHVGKRLRLVDDAAGCASDIFIITVGTPVDPVTKKPNLDYIRTAAAAVGQNLSRENLIILRSTVMVGTTRNVVIPELERVSGLTAGRDFFVAYCPERTAEGQALKELTHLPQIVGGLDEKSVELASRLFNEYTPSIIRVDGLEAAELCKLMDNVYRDVKFAFANQLAELAEIMGLDIHALIEAVNHNYSRNDIPLPSPGVGGPCLTKDPYILGSVFERHGMRAPLVMAARTINERAPRNILEKARALLANSGKSLAGATVFVVGFAFKGQPETSDLRDSTTLWLLEALRGQCRAIRGFDPVVSPAEIAALGVSAVGLEEGFAGADAVFVMNNHRSYLSWDIPRLLGSMERPALFYDAWRLFPKTKILSRPGMLYAAVGVG
jgi:UDP-N-acetyl-D-mannosaminuronic acid dehydrogenase